MYLRLTLNFRPPRLPLLGLQACTATPPPLFFLVLGIKLRDWAGERFGATATDPRFALVYLSPEEGRLFAPEQLDILVDPLMQYKQQLGRRWGPLK